MALLFLNKVTSNQQAFAERVEEISYLLGIDPNWLMFVMDLESGLNPRAVNASTSATGLIQFLPSTAFGLGTSTQQLLNMSNVQQLDYVYKYLNDLTFPKNYLIRKSYVDLYLGVFYPAAIGQADGYMFPANVVRYNPIFDQYPKDGMLTVGEMRQYMADRVRESVPYEYWDGFFQKKSSFKQLHPGIGLCYL